jgi:hypothetical protein
MTGPSPALTQMLGHPKRRAILRLMLADDAPPYTPAELSKLVQCDLPNVVYHVRTLEQFDCVQLDQVEGRGGLKHHYVPGALVKAHPDYVSSVLAHNDHPA